MIAHDFTHSQLNSSDFPLLILVDEFIHVTNIDVDSATGSYLRQVTLPDQPPAKIRGGLREGEQSFQSWGIHTILFYRSRNAVGPEGTPRQFWGAFGGREFVSSPIESGWERNECWL